MAIPTTATLRAAATFMLLCTAGALSATTTLAATGRQQRALPTTTAEFAALIGNRTAKEVIKFNGPIFASLVLSRIAAAETPVQVHQITVGTAALWEAHAACHPRALGFLGSRVPIDRALCASPDSIHALAGLVVHRLMVRVGYTDNAAALAALLAALRIPHDDLTSTDMATPQGWANARAAALFAYFERDGWNWRGAITRERNRRPYEDSTAYAPVNPPAPRPPTRPLRWAPLVEPADMFGRFAAQEHSYPHIGWMARPLALATADLHARRVAGPYDAAQAAEIGEDDRRKVEQGLDDLLARQRNLTRQRTYEAAWWESKIASLGQFSGFYERSLGLDEFNALRLGLGEILAQHDAVVLAWREKRRHDLVRPITLMQSLRSTVRALAFIPAENAVRDIPLREWASLLPAQPHSEFPSGSAALCRASLDHMKYLVESFVGDGNVPPFGMDLSSTAASLGLQPPFNVQFDTLEDAYRNCGESRLWAGVHFQPAVDKGYELVDGIGKAAFEQARDLADGRVPAVCERCHENWG